MSPVDNLWITRRALRSKSVDNSSMLDRYLTSSVRSFAVSERLKACCSRVRLNLTPQLCLILGVLITQTIPAQATTTDHYKLYAHSRIVNYEQFLCLSKIIHKESRWNVNAKNGSHFGLGQMRSKWYRNLDGYRQIDATIKYIDERYGSMCNAWRFHERVGHY
jgi:hypothetical protein